MCSDDVDFSRSQGEATSHLRASGQQSHLLITATCPIQVVMASSNSFTLMTDSDIKALTEALPGESFETTAFTTPPPLADATVAIVTTASLHHPDQDDFEVMDTGYRVLDDSRRDYVTGHWSPNFDGSGFAYDMNTVFPVDRLDELAERGVIGRVADQHLAYAGNQFDLSAIRMDSGPAGARFLRDQGVDVVLLTPV